MLPAFGSIGNPLDTTDRGVYDAQNVYSGSIRALADDPSVSLVAVVQDCSPGLSARGANNYRRIAQTVADAAREIAKPVVFFNTAAGGLHAHVIEPFAGSNVAVMQGARASLLAISRLFAHARFAPSAEPQTLAPASDWRDRLATGTPFTERESKAFLAAHGIAVTRERLARDADSRRPGRRRDRVPGGAEDRVAGPAAQDRSGRRARRPRRCCRGRGGL